MMITKPNPKCSFDLRIFWNGTDLSCSVFVPKVRSSWVRYPRIWECISVSGDTERHEDEVRK